MSSSAFLLGRGRATSQWHLVGMWVLSRRHPLSPSSAALIGAAALGLWKIWSRLRRRGLPPGRDGVPLFGETFQFVKDPSAFIAKGLETFGGTFFSNCLAGDTVMLKPSHANIKLFTTQRDLGWPPHFLDVVGRTSLPMVNDPLHKRMRVVSGRAFTPQLLDSYLEIFHELTQKHLDAWIAWPEPRDVRDSVKLYTFELAQKIILGLEVPEKEMKRMMDLFGTAISGLACLFPLDLPGFHFRKVMAARRELCAIYQRMIDEKRKRPPAAPKSMLEHVMAGSGQDGEAPSDVELQDFCFAMAFAGHDTTLSTMQTMLQHLDSHPHVKLALEEEVASVWDGDSPVTRALLQRLHKCRAFALESMRLVPPVANVSRTLDRDANIDGFAVPKGVRLMIGLRTVTDRTSYTDAGNIELDRYLDGQGAFADKTHEFASCATFGCGARMCIGYKFALDEQTVFLLNLLRRFDFKVFARDRVHFPFNHYRVRASFSKK